MKRAIVGYTGFVGSNLCDQLNFTHFYNSKNISDIRNLSFDEIYFCGLPAEKWKSNLYPEKDLENINGIIANLKTVQCDRFVLISTVDVYQSLDGVDENSKIIHQNHHAYGTHRYYFENFIKDQFQKVHIVRLPGLFGKGLKKNIIYDFLKDNEVFKIESRNVFQFYSLHRLSDDIQKVIDHNIELINISSEPISVEEVHQCLLNKEFQNHLTKPLIHYNMKSSYDYLFGGSGGYLISKSEVMQDLKEFSL